MKVYKPLAVLLLLLAVGGIIYIFTKEDEKDEAYTIGIVTWVGYGPLFIAQEKGFFEDEGISIEIAVMDDPGGRVAAFKSGSIDFFPNTPDAFSIFKTQGLEGTIVLPLDESRGADGLVAKAEIEDIASLKGKTVGFQSGITSHFFLLYLLDQAGLSGEDVVQENLGAGEAGAAFVAGHLDSAVTWEPWLTNARDLPNAHVLATSADTPGLLADVLMVSDNVLKNHRDDLLSFVRAWFRAVEFYGEYPDESEKIIAEAFGLEVSETKEMLSTVHFFSLNESYEYLGTRQNPGRMLEVFNTASRLYEANGVIDSTPEAENLVDPSIIEELHAKED